MFQNAGHVVIYMLVSVVLILGSYNSCSAQLFQLDEPIAQAESQARRGGYITEFLSHRSGEPGVFGFISWMLSKELWNDFTKYVEKKIKQKMSALLQELEERNAEQGDLGFHALDIFSQPLVFV